VFEQEQKRIPKWRVPRRGAQLSEQNVRQEQRGRSGRCWAVECCGCHSMIKLPRQPG